MKYSIDRKHLETLKLATKNKRENGLANFEFARNIDGDKTYVFRVVCEEVPTKVKK